MIKINTIDDAQRLMRMIKKNKFKLAFFNETGFTTRYLYKTNKKRFMRIKDVTDEEQERNIKI